MSIELDREEDGRWIAEVLELPGVMVYGSTRDQAIGAVERLAVEVVADGSLMANCLDRVSTWHL